MTRPGYAQLQDVILDPDFPELDLALRRGRHVDRDDIAWYALLGDAQDHLEAFYRRYGCELIHKPDGYFYLLPTGDKLSRRQLAPGDMLVGQALALLYLHPSTVERAGLHTQEELIAQLAAVMGSDALIRAFNPKRRRYDERVAQKAVRSRVGEAVRRLAALGFVELASEEQLRLRPSLLRFAEPVRGLSEPAEALAQLVARGEIALEEDGAAGGAGGAATDDDGEADTNGDGDRDGEDGDDGAAAGEPDRKLDGDGDDGAAAGEPDRELDGDGDDGAAAGEPDREPDREPDADGDGDDRDDAPGGAAPPLVYADGERDRELDDDGDDP